MTKEQTFGRYNKPFDIIIIGASLGGVLAAYQASKEGFKVLLTEETDWIGGQLTSQAVPLDEHRWIETTGCSQTYRMYRNQVRSYYRHLKTFSDIVKQQPFFCPGGSTVSRLAHPPKLALSLLNEMLKPYVEKGNLTILLNTTLKAVETANDLIQHVTIETPNESMNLKASFYLDGTDHGDLIYLSNTEYRIGAESKAETNEPSAKEKASRQDIQPITWVAALSYDDDEQADHRIEKPEMFDYFYNYQMPYDKHKVLSMYGPDSRTQKAKEFGFFNDEVDAFGNRLFGLWTYRRIVNKAYLTNETMDVTLLNWPQNDYFMNNIIETEDDNHHKYMAKQLTLSLIYYLQNYAPRKDGKIGYKGLVLRKDILGTEDGLAKAPYIREGRRIKSEFLITEPMISKQNASPATFFDSVGVGSYSIDLHITTQSHTFCYIDTHPFEIPLGAFIPIRMKNIIPATKNIGTTQLTNGCYRVHPVEWNIGEVAGLLGSYAIKHQLPLTEIRNNEHHLKSFQRYIMDRGIQIHWKEDADEHQLFKHQTNG